MKKFLIMTNGLVALLALSMGCGTMRAKEAGTNAGAVNTRGDLFGENMGDQVAFNWVYQDGTKEYIIYRSTSFNGPWAELDRIDDRHARTSGGKVDVTPDARLKHLSYKVEAIDGKGEVIRRYEPICVPKFVES